MKNMSSNSIWHKQLTMAGDGMVGRAHDARGRFPFSLQSAPFLAPATQASDGTQLLPQPALLCLFFVHDN